MLSDDGGFNPFSVHQNKTSYWTLKISNSCSGSASTLQQPQVQWKVTPESHHVHLFADFSPSLLQAVDGATVEGRRDLQDPVVVVETAADVRHSHPLLYGAGPGAHVGVGHNLWGHQVTHLDKEKRRGSMRGCSRQSQGGLDHVTGGQPGSYVIEVLAGFHYVWRPFHLIHLHPSLSQELSGRGAQTHVVSSKVRNVNISLRKCVLSRSIYSVFEVYWPLPAHKNEFELK